MKIQPIRCEQDCSDCDADTFLILDDNDIEVMRCSTRAIAENWIAQNPNGDTGE